MFSIDFAPRAVSAARSPDRLASRFRPLAAALLSAGIFAAEAAPSPVASYAFGNSFASSVAGAPALVPVDPLGSSNFTTDSVSGVSRTVYSFQGVANPIASQAGLTLDTTGLLGQNTVYSLEIVFKFTANANAWRRIVDVSSRSTDTGFYVDPSNNLNVYPVAGGSAFSNDVYHDVFLVNNAGNVTFYLDGSAQKTVATTVMNIDASNRIGFFLDNFQGGGLYEYSSGSIASLRLYDTALDAVPPPDLPPVLPVLPAVPEPETYFLMLAGLGALGLTARRHRPV